MKCPTCGSDIGAQALFCGACGTPIAAEGSGAVDADSLETKAAPAKRRGRTTGARSAEVTGAAGDTASQRASFKGAMDTSHKKARRKMPVLVLMAIFMFVATTLAWALYTIINPTVANEREIDWTPEALYEAMDVDRFDLEAQLAQGTNITRMTTVRVSVPTSIANAEGDRLNFVVEEKNEPMVIIRYRIPDGGYRTEVLSAAQAATR